MVRSENERLDARSKIDRAGKRILSIVRSDRKDTGVKRPNPTQSRIHLQSRFR
jgi:hypothetical protein